MLAGFSNANPQIGHVSSSAPCNVAVVYVPLLSNSTSTCEAKWCLHTKTYMLDALSAVQIAKSCCKALIAPLYCLPELRSGVKLLSLFISVNRSFNLRVRVSLFCYADARVRVRVRVRNKCKRSDRL